MACMSEETKVTFRSARDVVDLARMKITLYSPRGTSSIEAKLARTPAARVAGFANRPSVGFEEAIFFAFPQSGTYPFTMADTLVPLDMLFIDEYGRVVAVVSHAAPRNPSPYTPTRPFRYVLETAAGRLAAHRVGMDTVVRWELMLAPE